MIDHQVSSLFQLKEKCSKYPVRCLIPDMPETSDLIPYLERIQKNSWYSNFGPLLLEYETRLAAMTGISAARGQCVTLASGTAALEAGIAALELAPGSRVLLPAFTFPATVLAVMRSGMTAVLADVSEDSWLLTPEIALETMKHQSCELVIPVATFGCAIAVTDWDCFSEETGVPVLVDAAAALGEQQVGERTNVVFSLHATKPLGIGEGGVFATMDTELAESVRCKSNYGFEKNRVNTAGGANAKLSEYAAAVGLAQLDRWAQRLEVRRSLYSRYRSALQTIPEIELQSGFDNYPPAVLSVNLPQQATIVADCLASAGIETRRWYLPPLNRHPAFQKLDCLGVDGEAKLPATERLAIHNLGLPFHTGLLDSDIQTIVNVLGRCLEAK